MSCRSPLTNIIGFTELLDDDDRAVENRSPHAIYLDHIGNVRLQCSLDHRQRHLDLATVDAGIMELDISDVSVTDAVTTASGEKRPTVSKEQISADIRIYARNGSSRADASRVK